MIQYIHPTKFRDELEEQINKWANSIAHEYKIYQNTFRINLINPEPRMYPVISRITNGAVVQIALTIPWVDKNKDVGEALLSSIRVLKKAVRSIFRYLSLPKINNDDELFNPLIISDKVHEYIRGEKGTFTWKVSAYNPHNIKRRDFKISVHREVKVVVIHKETKTSYAIVDTNNRPEYDLIREALEKCIENIEINVEKTDV